MVCTYGACAVEKLIAGGMVPRAVLEPHAPALLSALFAALGQRDNPNDHNEYVMKGEWGAGQNYCTSLTF